MPDKLSFVQFVLHIWTMNNIHVLSTSNIDENISTETFVQGIYNFEIVIPKYLLAPNEYKLTFAAGVPNVELMIDTEGPYFTITDTDSYAANWSIGRKNVVIGTPFNWFKI